MAATYTLQDPRCAPLILIHMQMAGYTGARRRGIEDWRLLDHVFPLPLHFPPMHLSLSLSHPYIHFSPFLPLPSPASSLFSLSVFLHSRPFSFSFPLSPFLYFSPSTQCSTLPSFFLCAPSVPRVNLKVVFLREHSGSMHFVVAISRAILAILYMYTQPPVLCVMYLHLSLELEFEAPLINGYFGIRKFPRYCIINTSPYK